MINAPIRKTTLILLSITFIGVFPLDVILPSFPAISRHFSEPTENIAFSLSLFIFGFSIAQLLIGPLSDILGRRRLLLIGLCLAGIGAVGVCLTDSFNAFLFFRTLQAIGCGSFVLVNALIQDIYDSADRHTIRIFTTTGGGFFIATAPLMGMILEFIGSWRTSFVFFVAASVLVIIAITTWIPRDTLQEKSFQGQKTGISAKALFNRVFLQNSTLSAIGFSCHFAFIVQSPVIFFNDLLLSQSEFSGILLTYGIAYLAGGFIARYISHRVDRRLHIIGGLLTMLCAGVLLILGCSVFPGSSLSILGPMIICTCGITILRPAATTAAMDELPDQPGTASSLHNAIIFFIGAATSALVTLAPLSPLYNLSASIIFLTFIGLAISRWPCREKVTG